MFIMERVFTLHLGGCGWRIYHSIEGFTTLDLSPVPSHDRVKSFIPDFPLTWPWRGGRLHHFTLYCYNLWDHMTSWDIVIVVIVIVSSLYVSSIIFASHYMLNVSFFFTLCVPITIPMVSYRISNISLSVSYCIPQGKDNGIIARSPYQFTSLRNAWKL